MSKKGRAHLRIHAVHFPVRDNPDFDISRAVDLLSVQSCNFDDRLAFPADCPDKFGFLLAAVGGENVVTAGIFRLAP